MQWDKKEACWQITNDAVEVYLEPVSTRARAAASEHSYLLEHQSYSVTVILKIAARVCITITGLDKTKAFTHHRNQYNTTLSLEDVFGDLEVAVLDGQTPLIKGQVEVRPYKIDYTTHLPIILEEIQAISEQLVVALWQGVTVKRRQSKSRPTGSEILATLEGLWKKLTSALLAIQANPDKNLELDAKWSSVNRGGIPMRSQLHRLPTKPGALVPAAKFPASRLTALQTASGPVIPVTMPFARRELSFDTAANRFVLYAIIDLRKRLALLKAAVFRRSATDIGLKSKEELIASIEEKQTFLGMVESADFLQGLSPSARTDCHVLHLDPRYRDVLKICQALRWGLSRPTDEQANRSASLRRISDLYEMWCFLYIVGCLMEDGWQVQPETLHKTHLDDLQLHVTKGKSSTVILTLDTDIGSKFVEVVYRAGILPYRSAAQDGLGSTSHKMEPDIIIKVTDELGKRNFWVFDAKYRIGENGGPEDSDIDKMHTYKDAIIQVSGHTRALNGAFALFPCPDPRTYKGHRYYGTISDGHGGLPLIPGDDNNLFRDYLRSMFSEAISPFTEPH